MIHIEKMNDKTQVSDEKEEVEYIDIEWWNSTRKPTITLDIYTAWTIRSHFVDTDVAYRIERRKKRELKIFSLFQGLIQWTKKKTKCVERMRVKKLGKKLLQRCNRMLSPLIGPLFPL